MKDHPDLPAAFRELGLNIELLKGVHSLGFSEPSDIQRAVIPLILERKDVIGQARTGTGKTAAFSLPIIQLLDPQQRLQAVVLVPTRELAVQVTAEVRRLAEFTPFRAVPIYGGQAIKHQLKVLGRKTQIVVATPGRINDLLDRRKLHLDEVKHVVLDEVDRMLDIGFIDAIRKFLRRVPQPHQTIFVSATISDEIKALTRQFMKDPVEVNVSEDELTVDKIQQGYYSVERWDKFRLLRHVLQEENPKLAIVFTNTKHQARKLAKKLHESGVNVKEIHGDLVQRKRERVMKRFRRHQIQVLVATDLAARGIDVQDISHIINFDIPQDPEVYVHRIGRTARMGAFGQAITFVTSEEGNELTRIEMLINKQVDQLPLDSFTPRPPRETEEPVQQPALSRSEMPMFGAGLDDDNQPRRLPEKTLGGKFKPARRRR